MDSDEEIEFKPGKCAAPDVPLGDLAIAASSAVVPVNTRKVNFNPNYEQLWAPIVGPANPFSGDGLSRGLKNHYNGSVVDDAMSDFIFEEQYYTYQKFGYAADTSLPKGANIIGDLNSTEAENGSTVFNLPSHVQKKRKAATREEKSKEGLQKGLDPSDEKWIENSFESPWGGKRQGIQTEKTEEQKFYTEEHAKKRQARENRENKENNKEGNVIEPVFQDSTVFHAESEVDYQGRSWIEPPRGIKSGNRCYIPKKCFRTWVGHKGNVMTIQFFPKSGHLLLSGSTDQEVKIWDVHNSGECMRSYRGHTSTIRHVSFNNDGSKFLSVSYDKKIALWDTETGKAISTFTTGNMPYVAKIHPDDDKQNVIMAAMKDKKVVQWDANTGNLVQQYNEHLDAVNTITFIDDNKRFVTSSDDRKLLVWEFGIPVVVKHISETNMQSMPSIAVHPSGKYFAAQCMDNKVVLYDTNRFKFQRRRFFGHTTGVGCQVNFSPDGEYLISGDAAGRCFIWDWKKAKVVEKIQAFRRMCIGCEWHPLETSKIATCGWDEGRNIGKDGVGVIKLWD